MINQFEQLGVSPKIVKAISELGFVEPTPIQEQAIPVLLKGDRDFVGLAQTGTGKTAAFGLPLLETIDLKLKQPQALVLCPTRELCLQITRDLQNFGKHMEGFSAIAVYGGASIINQIKDLKRGVHVVVATPGRMLDMIDRKAVNFSNVNYVVLDEADEMLNMGFQEDINSILSVTPEEKFTWLFSATMPAEVRRIAKNYMDDPFELTIGSKNTGNVNIEHEYYVVRPREKYAALKRIVDYNPDVFGIVFSRTKIETQEIAEALIKDGYNADSLHGDLSQQQRDKVMKRYRDRSLQLLIATDVAARGIDVSDVTHVINYSLPDDIESYTHRSGRTGRAGKTGISIALITSKDIGKIRQIEKTIGKKFTAAELPTGFDVCEKQLFGLVHRVHNVAVNEEQIGQYMQRIYDEFSGMDKDEVIKRFVSLEFNRFLEYYKNAPDLNVKADDRGSDRNSMRTRESGNSTRLFINLGSVDEFTRGDMLRFICDNGNIAGSSVGRIDIKGVYSFFEVDNDKVNDVVNGFKSVDFHGRNVRIEISNDGDRKRSDRRKSYGGGDSGRRREGGDRGGYSSSKRSSERSSSDKRSDRPRKDRKDSGRGGRW